MAIILDNIGLYEISYAFLFVFAIFLALSEVKYWPKILTFLIALFIINPMNSFIQTRWQITLGYFFLIVAVYVLETRSFEKTLVFTTITYLNLNIIDQFYLLLSQYLSIEQFYFYLIYLGAGCLIIVMLMTIEHQMINYFLQKFPDRKYQILALISIICLLLLGPAIYQTVAEFAGESQEITRFVMAINLTIFILFIVGSFIVYYGLNKIKEAERQLANQKINKEYSNMITQQYTEMRRFRHDYKNVLLSLEGLIREEAWPSLKSYFFNEIASEQNNFNIQSDQLSRLVYIQNPEIRMIFYSKLNYALANHIDIHVEVSETLPTLQDHLMALSRMVGIILDNAIEESQKYDEAVIEVLVTDIKEEEVLIMVSNPTETHPSQLAKMNELGFSTKGTDRGFGLTNLQELADDSNMQLYTSIEDRKFIQELYIPLLPKEA